MTPLVANFKHFYQCRSMWVSLALYLFIFAALVIYLLLPGPFRIENVIENFCLLSFVLLPMIVCPTSSLQKTLLSRPFTYCLPGHHLLPRRVLFRVCFLNAPLPALFLLGYQASSLLEQLLLIGSAAALGLAASFLYIHLVFYTKNYQNLMAISFLLWYIVLFFDVFDVSDVMWHAVADHPVANILAAGALGILTWRRLGDQRLLWKDCGKVIPGVGAGSNRRIRQRIRRDQQNQKMAGQIEAGERALERFLVARMHRTAGPERHLWGSLYAFATKYMNRTVLLPLLFPFFAIIGLGYLFPDGGHVPLSIGRPINQAAFIIMPCLVANLVPLPISSPLLLPGGRKERFLAGCFTGVMYCALASGAALCVAWLSMLIEPFMPEWSAFGTNMVFRPADPHCVILPFAVMPFFLAWQVLLPQSGRGRALLVLPWATIIPIILIASGCAHYEAGDRMDILWVGGVAVGGWLIFLRTLDRACNRRDLECS